MAKRVIVTGASGFIGQNCLRYLKEKNFEIHALSRISRPAENGVVWHQVDLFHHLETTALIKNIQASHFLNLAWDTEHGKFWTSTYNMQCVQASLNALVAFSDAGGQRFVGAGSCAEYDWRYGYLSESLSPCQPLTPFGKFKYALYTLSSTYAALKKLSFAWGRIFFVYGPNEPQSKLISSTVLSLLSSKVASCSFGHHVRDFVYVDFVAEAFTKLLEGDFSGPINIGSGEAMKIGSLVKLIAAKLDQPNLTKIQAIKNQEETSFVVANTSLLSDFLIKPIKIEEGVSKMIEFYKNSQVGVMA